MYGAPVWGAGITRCRLARNTFSARVITLTSVVTIFVSYVTGRIRLTGSTPVTGVISGTAIGTAHGGNRTFRPHLTSIVITVARFSGRSVFSVTVWRVLTVFRFADTIIILSVTRTAGNGIFTGTIGRSVFIFVLTTTVNVTFKRRGHIVVILGTDISAVNIGRRMHSIVFLAVSVNVSAALILRTTADVSFQIIGEPIDTGDFDAGSGSKRLRQ